MGIGIVVQRGRGEQVADKMKVLMYWISKIGSCAGAEEV
jgi:hypothetical protein